MKDYLSNENTTCPEDHPSKFTFEQIMSELGEMILLGERVIHGIEKANHRCYAMTKWFPWDLI